MNGNVHQNRRRETRRYHFGERLSWRPDGPRFRCRKGWLNDISRSGLSFFVEHQRGPAVGEQIQLDPADAAPTRRYRVVRVQDIEGKLALVGCERDLMGPVAR